MISDSGRVARAQSGAMPYRGRYCGIRLSRPARAEAPANHSALDGRKVAYTVLNTSPRSRWARYARARPFASPPMASASAGISMVVTIEPPISKTLMINAAHVRSLRVLRTREARTSAGVSPSPLTRGMIATPVSPTNQAPASERGRWP